MKNILTLLFATLIISCSKEDDNLRAIPAPANIVNLWEMTKNVNSYYENGVLMETETTIVPPNEYRILFRNDNTFSDYESGTSGEAGTYTYAGSDLTIMSDFDSIVFTTMLNPTTLIMTNIEYDISFGDTSMNKTELTFVKI